MQTSLAYQTLGESGEIVQTGKYRAGTEIQFASGANLTGFVDANVSDSSSLRVHLGAGDVDFYAGASYKWIPFPDFEQQPAIGMKAGVTIGREGTDNFFVLHGSPLVSKKMDFDQGLFVPYAGIPITLTTSKSKTVTGLQLSAGTEYSTPKLKSWGFTGEIGINLKDSQSYAAFSASFTLDDQNTKKGK